MKIALHALAVCGFTRSSRAQDTGWKAGLATANITPSEPLFMAGYASRDKPFEEVEAELFAKAGALTDGEH